MIFKDDKTYKILKYLFSIALPAIEVFYITLSDIWTGIINLPYPEQVAATLAAITVLGNALMGFSAEKYDAMRKNGEIAEDKTYRNK